MPQKLDLAEYITGAMRVRDGIICQVCNGITTEATDEEREHLKAHLRRFRQPWLRPCDCAKRAREYQEHRYSWMNLPEGVPKTFANFEGRPGAVEALRAAKTFAEDRGPAMLTLVGGTGCGKSHLAEAVLRSRYVPNAKGHPRLRYELVGEMLQRLRATFDHQGEDMDTHLRFYQAMNILVLDDLGEEKESDWTVEILTNIIDRRYRDQLRTIITTNKTERELRASRMFRLADRIYDVHTGAVRVVQMACASYRTGN